jgi:hypothetical protein
MAFAEHSKRLAVPVIMTLFMYLVFFFGTFQLSCADPMSAAGVLAACYFAFYYLSTADKIYLWLATLCTMLAVLAKQPAWLWALLTWPALLFLYDQKIQKERIICFFVPVLCIGIWYLFEGSGVLDNRGVIEQSIQNRNFMEQIRFGLSVLFLPRPFLILFFLFAFYAGLKSRFGKFILVFLFIPGMSLLIVYGAYSGLRNALHFISISALLIAFNWSALPFKGFNGQSGGTGTSGRFSFPIDRRIISALALAFLAAGLQTADFFRPYPFAQGHRNTLQTIYREFPDKITALYDQPNLRLFTHQALYRSLFYGHATIVYPEDHDSTPEQMLDQLIAGDVAYVYPPYWKDFTPLGQTTRLLFEELCPDLLVPYIVESGADVYRVNKTYYPRCKQKLSGRQKERSESK